jgi:hypothetical protein
MLSDEQLLEIQRVAVDDAMHAANTRDGYGSNMSRESIVAGLRAVEAAVRADMQPREVEVTADMVRRADAAYWKSANDCDDHADPMRDALVAALGGGE